MEQKNRIIVALDTNNLNEARAMAEELSPYVGAFKVGLELITSEGAPEVAKSFKGKLFFDGKFKDIPNTVAGAARAATSFGVWMFNVHCLGGVAMMVAAKTAAEEEAKSRGLTRPLIIGVTVLTSLDVATLNELGFCHISDGIELKKLVVRLALLAKQAGLDGVVASPQEIADIRQACGKDFLIVTPGIRPSWAATGDQKRITTPKDAISAGADYIVIGRPITSPPESVGSRKNAAKKILEEIK